MKLFLKLCSSFLILFMIVSCSGSGTSASDDTGGAGDSKLAIIDIAGSESLFISSGNTSSGRAISDSSSNKLFKITDDGYVLEVSYLDENEEKYSEDLTPTDIYNVDDDYIIICFSSTGYLVRKSDGAVYSLDTVGIPYSDQLQYGNFINADKIQTDSSGNIYYQYSDVAADGVKVLKIDISNPESLSAKDYSPATDAILGFNISPAGHMDYTYGDGSSNRIKKSNGGIYNLPSDCWLAHWVGIDGNIKYQKSDTEPGTVVSVLIDSSDFSVSTEEQSGDLDYLNNISSYLLRFTDSTLIISQLNEYINEVENASDTPRKVEITEIDDINLVVASDSYYYISGNDSSNNPLLIKVDPEDDSVVTLLTAGLYDIYTMVVSDDDVVTFNALRMSDGKKIIGEVDASGTFTLLDEEIDSEITILERIK